MQFQEKKDKYDPPPQKKKIKMSKTNKITEIK